MKTEIIKIDENNSFRIKVEFKEKGALKDASAVLEINDNNFKVSAIFKPSKSKKFNKAKKIAYKEAIELGFEKTT